MLPRRDEMVTTPPGSTPQLSRSSGWIDAIVGTIGRLVHEVIGEDVEVDLDITADSSFSEDIELESIEFVALAEKLQGDFGREVDFAGWLSTMELDRILTLKVGDLVRYIDGQRG